VTIFSGNMLFSVFSLLNSVLIARLLGPELKGELAIFLLVASMLSLVLRLGLDIAVIKRLKNKSQPEESYVASSILATLGSLLIGGILFFILFRDSFLIPIEVKSSEYYKFVYLFMILETLCVLLSAVLLGQEYVKRYALTICILPITQTVFILGLLNFNSEITISNVVLILILGYCVKLSVLLVYLRNIIFSMSAASASEVSVQLKFGIKAHIGNVIDFFVIRTDLILLGFYYDLRIVGIYSVAMLSEKLNIVSTSIGSSLLANLSSVDEYPKINKIIRLSLLPLIGINILVYLIAADAMLLLFGAGFADAGLPLSILILGYSLLYITKAIKPMFIIVDQPFLLTKASALCLCFNVIFNLALIPKFGMIGASIATTIANSVYTVFLVYHYLKITKSRFLDLVKITSSDLNSLRDRV
jgi:O-antigen/teichoic acid export membrane protein